MGHNISVLKRDKSRELFSEKKLCNSLLFIGVDERTSYLLCHLVKKSIRRDVSSDEIFRLTRDFLFERDPGLSALYALERGLSVLGPSGFVFEQYVAAMFQDMGYSVRTNIYLEGEGVSHEIDVYARKGNVIFLSEAKYRNDFKTRTHIDQVMYADARLQDIRRRARQKSDTREYYMWVITNTRFTDNAILYAVHRDLQLLGWNQPPFINFMKIVYERKLYPVTILPSITKDILKKMSTMDLILVKNLASLSVSEYQEKFGLSQKISEKLFQEVQELLGNKVI